MVRAMVWDDSVLGSTIATGAEVIVPLSTTVQGESRGQTVIRSMYDLSASSVSIAGAYGVQSLDIGIGITSLEAFTAGIVPDPGVQTEKPARGWLWKANLTVSQNGISTPVVANIRADVRGMREIQNGVVYLVVANKPIRGTTFTIDLSGLVRLLIKLP